MQPDNISGNWVESSGMEKKGLAKEEHDGYDSRHKNLPDDLEDLIHQPRTDYD